MLTTTGLLRNTVVNRFSCSRSVTSARRRSVRSRTTLTRKLSPSSSTLRELTSHGNSLPSRRTCVVSNCTPSAAARAI